MTDRLIRITTALAAATVAAVAAVISYRLTTWSALIAKPASPPGSSMLILDANRRNRPVRTTPGALVPGRRHRGHHRCQPGTRPRPRSDWRPGQRLTRPGTGRFL
jgi:hypothetical protein